ncbi:MAG: phosphodiester glycosidase family protein [Clostridiales bacterium]|nr:phosphodiester glycosidase family protein [Clostridiales bacterium]
MYNNGCVYQPKGEQFSMKKWFGILAVLLCLTMLPLAVAEETEPLLPIDFSAGMEPDPDFYLSDREYEDPTLHITIEELREDGCDYWVARIKVADASQLRTMSAGGFDTSMSMKGTALAKRVNAVLAIDGDYYCYTGSGYILRQGQLYLDLLNGERDVLLIDEDGDFHVVHLPKAGEVSDTVDGKKVINAFYFGPILVENGQVPEVVDGPNMAATERRQRMCIAQVGPLEYMVVCCEAPARGSSGMTLRQFAELVATLGVETAYNLDGGDSTMLIFDGEKLNDVTSTSTRSICDIIYFASAYEEE